MNRSKSLNITILNASNINFSDADIGQKAIPRTSYQPSSMKIGAEFF